MKYLTSISTLKIYIKDLIILRKHISGREQKQRLAFFLLAARSSVLKLKEADENGDRALFLQALKIFEQLSKLADKNYENLKVS